MKSKIISFIFILVIIIGLVSAMYMCANANESITEKEKIEEEIAYLDTKIITSINYINNIELQNYKITVSKIETSSKEEEGSQEDSTENKETNEEEKITKMEEDIIVDDNEEVDWNSILGELEILYSTWPTIILDLYSINVDSDTILKFSTRLDEAIISAKNMDKKSLSMYLSSMYSYLPEFLDKNNVEKREKNVIQVKSYIINAYAYIEASDWQNAEEEISNAEEILVNLVNNIESAEYQTSYNKSYVLLEELKNSLSTEDKDIFYLKYKNLLEELNIIDQI